MWKRKMLRRDRRLGRQFTRLWAVGSTRQHEKYWRVQNPRGSPDETKNRRASLPNRVVEPSAPVAKKFDSGELVSVCQVAGNGIKSC